MLPYIAAPWILWVTETYTALISFGRQLNLDNFNPSHLQPGACVLSRAAVASRVMGLPWRPGDVKGAVGTNRQGPDVLEKHPKIIQNHQQHQT